MGITTIMDVYKSVLGLLSEHSQTKEYNPRLVEPLVQFVPGMVATTPDTQ
jgi:hypothetical protein